MAKTQETFQDAGIPPSTWFRVVKEIKTRQLKQQGSHPARLKIQSFGGGCSNHGGDTGSWGWNGRYRQG